MEARKLDAYANKVGHCTNCSVGDEKPGEAQVLSSASVEYRIARHELDKEGVWTGEEDHWLCDDCTRVYRESPGCEVTTNTDGSMNIVEWL
jgi:hypothetical protein